MYRFSPSQRYGKTKGMKIKHLVQLVALAVLLTWFMYQINTGRARKAENIDDEPAIVDPDANTESSLLEADNTVNVDQVADDELIDKKSIRISRKQLKPLDDNEEPELRPDEADNVEYDADDSGEGDGDSNITSEKHIRQSEDLDIKNKEDTEDFAAVQGEIAKTDLDEIDEDSGTTPNSEKPNAQNEETERGSEGDREFDIQEETTEEDVDAEKHIGLNEDVVREGNRNFDIQERFAVTTHSGASQDMSADLGGPIGWTEVTEVGRQGHTEDFNLAAMDHTKTDRAGLEKPMRTNEEMDTVRKDREDFDEEKPGEDLSEAPSELRAGSEKHIKRSDEIEDILQNEETEPQHGGSKGEKLEILDRMNVVATSEYEKALGGLELPAEKDLMTNGDKEMGLEGSVDHGGDRKADKVSQNDNLTISQHRNGVLMAVSAGSRSDEQLSESKFTDPRQRQVGSNVIGEVASLTNARQKTLASSPLEDHAISENFGAKVSINEDLHVKLVGDVDHIGGFDITDNNGSPDSSLVAKR